MILMKKVGVAAACLLLALSLKGCRDLCGILLFCWMANDDDRAAKSEIFAYVQENEDSLLACIEQNDYSALPESPVIRSVELSHGYIDFECGGAGMGPDTAYRGFFYSGQDDLLAVWCAPDPGVKGLTPKGTGYFWKEGGGDNTYYVEHICGHFYYYDAEF